jgi:NAD(P)-dependent dehydrogenase (short-subunit alcohol dehydrogenase family)
VNRFQDKVAVITGAAGGIGRAAARRFASEGARVVLVHISVSGLENKRDPNAARARFAESIPVRRYGRADEVAALVAFLCSVDASFINGAAYTIDGGSMA